jgi:hypothetical protein
MKTSKTIYLAIISRATGHWPMFNSIQAAAAHIMKRGYRIKIVPHVGDSLLCRGRQNLFHSYLNDPDKPEYLFTLDDDIEVPYDIFDMLIDAQKPIIGGVYRLKKDFDPKPEDEINLYNYLAFRKHPDYDVILGDEKPVEVTYVSTGCILYTREFCQRMWDAYPELSYKDNVTKEEKRALYMTMIEPNDLEYLSEDWAFCWRAKAIGEKIWLHPNVLCNHWGLKDYNSVEFVNKVIDWQASQKDS